MTAASGDFGIKQPAEYRLEAEKVTHLDYILSTYGVTPSENILIDLSNTGLLFRIDDPGTPQEVFELTCGRYDGLRFFGKDGRIAPKKPLPEVAP